MKKKKPGRSRTDRVCEAAIQHYQVENPHGGSLVDVMATQYDQFGGYRHGCDATLSSKT